MLGGDETYYGHPLLRWLWRRPRTWRPRAAPSAGSRCHAQLATMVSRMAAGVMPATLIREQSSDSNGIAEAQLDRMDSFDEKSVIWHKPT